MQQNAPFQNNMLESSMSYEDMINALEAQALGLESTSEEDLANQFLVFQLNNTDTGGTVLETSLVDPALNGSEEAPDVQMTVEMIAFHVGENEGIPENTRAPRGHRRAAAERRRPPEKI